MISFRGKTDWTDTSVALSIKHTHIHTHTHKARPYARHSLFSLWKGSSQTEVDSCRLQKCCLFRVFSQSVNEREEKNKTLGRQGDNKTPREENTA